MKRAVGFVMTLIVSIAAFAESAPAPRVVDLKTTDGVQLTATFFGAGKSGPGVLLLPQVNRDRRSWDVVAAQLAAAGINTLTLDMRGLGDSGGTRWEKLTDEELDKHWRGWPEDVDAALEFLRSQPRVNPEMIGVGGSGLLGVDNSVEVARRHAAWIKSLVLLSGETFRDGCSFSTRPGNCRSCLSFQTMTNIRPHKTR
jgi:predicted alpha/beta hydrolase